MTHRPIALTWDGETVTIPETQAFEVADLVEDIIPLGEFGEAVNSMKSRKIAECYSVMLNFAGIPVTKEEVFSKLISRIDASKGVTAVQAFKDAIEGLAAVLTNGMETPAGSSGGDDGKKPKGSLEKPSN